MKFTFLMLVVSCATQAPPPVDYGKTNPGACPGACATLAKLHCPEATPTCVTFCTDAEESGFLSIHPECVAESRDVSGVRACGVACKL